MDAVTSDVADMPDVADVADVDGITPDLLPSAGVAAAVAAVASSTCACDIISSIAAQARECLFIFLAALKRQILLTQRHLENLLRSY